MKWLTFPPIIAILTVMIARTFGGGSAVTGLDLSIWGLVWMLFITLCALYGMFIRYGFTKGLIPLQALTQGIILCPIAIVYGARMFQWVGVLLAVCGAAALVVIYNRTEVETHKVVELDVKDDIKKLPLNFAITDDTGVILNVTNSMLKVVDLSRAEILGQNIGEWFSPVSKTAEINGKIWDIKRVGLEGGKRYFFELTLKGLPGADEDTDSSSGISTRGSMQFFDNDTQLYSFPYGFARISDELYRAGRYDHEVSAVMIRLVFPQLLPTDDMDKYIRPFRAFCARVKKDLRQSDTAIQAGEFQILLVLSECPSHVVDSIIDRLASITNVLVPTFEEFNHVTVLNVHNTFDGGNNVPTAQELIDRMTQAITRKYSAHELSE